MVDGPTEISDIALTEFNRKLVQDFVEDVLINRQHNQLEKFINQETFTQHNPWIPDGLFGLRLALEGKLEIGAIIKYDRIHRTLAEGDFVLSVSEGSLDGIHSSFYDLFHVVDGKLIEHWDTIEAVPCRTEWKNDNGKF